MKSIILLSLIAVLTSAKFIPHIPMEKERFAYIYSFESYDFTFSPGSPQSINNPDPFFSHTLSCSISDSGSDTLVGVVTKGSGTLNGQSIPSGGQSVTVSQGSTIKVGLSAGGTIQITNKGSDTVQASCNLALEVPQSALTYTFQPGVSTAVKNPMPFKVKTHCTMSSSDASDDLTGHTDKGQVSINGQPVTGETKVTIHNSDVIELDLTGSAEGHITNTGANTVVANCNLGFVYPRSELTYTFVPGVSTDVKNPMPFKVKSHCTMSTPDASDDLTGHTDKGSVSINGQPVTGETKLTIKDKDVIELDLSGSAEGHITNTGTSTVVATCNLG